jgi:phosphomannomutase / phosphoglucomutase
MQLDQSIFRKYDIRGVYPDSLNPEVGEHIGKALGTYLRRKSVNSCAVGRDNRESSSPLSESLIKGLSSTGINVVDIGITLTPIVHFLTCTDYFEAGINISASHNPKEYNGIKIDLNNADPLYDEGLLELYRMVLEGNYIEGNGLVEKKDLLSVYIDFLKKRFSFSKKIKVILDCGNGATSLIAPKVLESLGCNIVPVECELNSEFPHGVPNPEDIKFMHSLEKKVLENQGAVGFAFDTDGDRVGVCDETGVSYPNDQILLLYAKDILKRHKGGVIVYDVKSSQVVEEFVTKAGGVPKMIQTGRAFFINEVRNGGLIGSELSGHTYFADEYFGFDDGIYAVCRVLKLMEESGEPLSYMMSKFPKRTSTPEIKVDCPDNEKFEVVKKIQNTVLSSSDYLNVSVIDGVRVKVSETGWFLIRASNTSPHLSIRVEGRDKKEIDYLLSQVDGLLSSI